MLGSSWLTPGPVEYEQKQEIIPTIEAKAKNMTSHVKFDERMGSCHYRTRLVDHKKKSPRAKLDDCIRLFGSRNVVPL